jgi:peptide/nickel transport system ATP-binding protein
VKLGPLRLPLHSRLGLLGACMLMALVSVALFAPLIAPYDPTETVGRPFLPPGPHYTLGTNDVGQDIFSELIYGARISLLIGFVGAVLATAIGVIVGLAAGGFGGKTEALLMRLVDLVLSVPFLPLTIVLSVFVGGGLVTEIAVIGGVAWARIARELRAQTLPLRDRGYIQAAGSMGAPRVYVMLRHLLPGVLPLVVPQFVRTVNLAIQLETSLSFLGLGDPTAKSWGSMLFYANSRSAFLTDAWQWWIVPPGIGVALTVLAFAFVGYDLESRSRPQLKGRGAARIETPPDATRVVMGDRALLVQDLNVSLPTRPRPAVDAVSFEVQRGEVVGVVGESGSGKTTLAMACLGLLRAPAVVKGRVLVGGTDLNQLGQHQAAAFRGDRVALIPQSAMNALNPVFTIEDQLIEAIQLHRKVSRAEARERVHGALELVHLDPSRGSAYPHEFSGGMRQRVLIAMALINEPDLVIADEPTTGLDILVQLEILDLLAELRERLDLTLLFISHDLPVVFRIADRVLFMHDGRMVDETRDLRRFDDVSHDYARLLIGAARDLEAPAVVS